MPKIKCPRCSSTNTIPIIYGYPSNEAHIKAEAGKNELGGCMFSPESPKRRCKNCDVAFGGNNYDWFAMAFLDLSFSSLWGTGKRYVIDFEHQVFRCIRTKGSFAPSLCSEADITLAKSMDELILEYQEIPIGCEDWSNVTDKLERLYLADWANTSNNPDILDGEQWQLDIQFSDQKLKTWTGSNACPPYFKDLMKLVDSFLILPGSTEQQVILQDCV